MWSWRRVAAAMPMNTPHAKKAVVTCCSHSHGCPTVRVRTSSPTESVKPPMDTPQRTIRRASSGSSAFHLRCRWRWMTSARYTAKESVTRPLRSLHVAHESEDLHGVRPQLFRQLILDRLRRLLEAGLVHVLYHLHANLLQLRRRVLLELQRHRRLPLRDLVRRRLHPLFLLIAQ